MNEKVCLKIYGQALSALAKKKEYCYEGLIEDEGLVVSEFYDFLVQKITNLTDKDEGDFVEACLSIIPALGIPENWLQIICNLLTKLNHHSHEDIISDLQNSKNPFCIPYLKKAVEIKPQLEYLGYDDYGSYYKKCLWALFAIDTKECKEIIKSYTQSSISELKKEAIYRLSKFENKNKGRT